MCFFLKTDEKFPIYDDDQLCIFVLGFNACLRVWTLKFSAHIVRLTMYVHSPNVCSLKLLLLNVCKFANTLFVMQKFHRLKHKICTPHRFALAITMRQQLRSQIFRQIRYMYVCIRCPMKSVKK